MLDKQYGINIKIFKDLLDKQKYKCPICEREFKKIQKDSIKRDQINVDHSHKTGKVRGLLCSPCNRAIGLLGESINTLTNAINYLTNKTI